MLPLTVFVAGAAGMALEIVGFRLLQPDFGNSIYVWGSLIGVFLLALAAGYTLGGLLADRAPRLRGLGGVILAAGVAIALVPAYAGPLGEALLNHFDQVAADAATVARFGSLLGGLALFGPAGTLLGMVTPYAVRLAAEDLAHLGRTAGSLAAWATAGSLTGTLGTAWYGIALLPTSQLLYLIGGILMLLGTLLIAWRGKRTAAAALSLAALLLLPSMAGAQTAGAQKEPLPIQRDTLYHRIIVRDSGPYRDLIFGGPRVQPQTRISLSDPLRSGWRYTDSFHLGPLLVPNARRALFVGLGGGVGPRQFRALYPQMQIDVVEIDPEVAKVARDYFFLKEDDRLKVFVEDGRAFIRKAKPATYDLVFLDAYFAEAIPFHLTTREFLSSVREKLTPGGAVFANFAGTFRGTGSEFFRSMYKTMETVYGADRCLAFSVGQAGGRNTIAYAVNGPLRVTPAELIARAKKVDSKRLPGVSQIAEGYRKDVPTDDVKVLSDDFAPVDNLIPLR